MRESPLLELEDVAASYGPFHVLNGVTLRVDAGEIIALIGANGAGKSTVLKAVAGFLMPRGGDVRLRGQSIGGLRPHQTLALGCAYVAQGQDLFPQMTVAQNVELGGYLIKDASRRRQRALACLDAFPALRRKSMATALGLSGGERQQLKLARALVTEPSVLLLDEPSAGLSPMLVDQVFSDLTEVVAASGVGVLLVEQNVSKAVEVADRVCVLELGRVVLDGPVSELGGLEAISQVYLGQSVPRMDDHDDDVVNGVRT